MNLLLLDVLACPIDKNFPLKLYIFSLNTNSEEIERIFIQDENILSYFEENGDIYIKDKNITETVKLKDYIKYILSKIDLLEYVVDETPDKIGSNFLKKIKTELKNKIYEISLNIKNTKIEEVLPELNLINHVLLDLRIHTGIFFCQKCGRWYPIYEGIPQLLPDDQRNEKEEIKRFGKLGEKLNQVLMENHSVI